MQKKVNKNDDGDEREKGKDTNERTEEKKVSTFYMITSFNNGIIFSLVSRSIQLCVLLNSLWRLYLADSSTKSILQCQFNFTM